MKQKLLMTAPFTSRSGYGEHARDLFYAFHALDKYEIRTIDVRWGDCPRNALDKDNPKHKILFDTAVTQENPMKQQPEIYIDIRIPNPIIMVTIDAPPKLTSGKGIPTTGTIPVTIAVFMKT